MFPYIGNEMLCFTLKYLIILFKLFIIVSFNYGMEKCHSEMKNKKCSVSKMSKGNIFIFLNLVFWLEDFGVNVSEFSYNYSKIFLSL